MKKYSIKDFVVKTGIFGYCSPLKLSRNEKNNIWRKKYKKSLNKYLKIYPYVENSDRKQSNYIFTSWLQGYDVAPIIVKKCQKSLKQYTSAKTIVNITLNNMSKYIELPQNILEKKEAGIISNAHFSDIIRVCLLYTYGGIWIDSTVMLFDELPHYVTDSELFFFQNSFLDAEDFGISSWFISAKYPKNNFMKSVRDTLFSYWENNNTLPDYYLLHDIISLLVETNQFENLWKKMPYVNNAAPHVLQRKLLDKYDQEEFNRIIKLTPIQKLTYKLENRQNDKKTNLSFILSD